MRQLTFLVTSPRVAPGLMSWPAWQAIASADRVLQAIGQHDNLLTVALDITGTDGHDTTLLQPDEASYQSTVDQLVTLRDQF